MKLKERIAEELAQSIRQIAQTAHNEEELRIGVEKLLEPALNLDKAGFVR